MGLRAGGEGRCCRVVVGIEGGVWAAGLKGDGTSGAHVSSIAPVAEALACQRMSHLPSGVSRNKGGPAYNSSTVCNV